MQYATLLVSGAFLLVSFSAFSQEEEQVSKWPSLTVGAGVMPYFGELQQEYSITALNHVRPAFHAGISKRFGNYFAVGVTGIYGKVAHHDHGLTRNRNFESKLTGGQLELILPFDNGIILPRSSVFAPYFKVGGGYFTFDPHGDLKDNQGRDYNYWSDGTLRDMPESDSTRLGATVISRDYTYETRLTDSTTNYQRSTIAIPVGGGAVWKFSRSFEANISATYYLTQTDWIDNYSVDGKKDKFLYLAAAFTWNIGYKGGRDQEARFKDVDFGKLDKLDSDGDGVNDMNDHCQNTPKSVKVDNKGCPLDADNDGVPDYRDKEPKSAKGALVDENGITLTDEMMAAKAAKYDSLATERKKVFSQNPSLQTLVDIEEDRSENRSGAKIPAELIEADLNKDNYISADEITKTIDLFFEGETNFTAEKLNKLIDFFFEQ